MPDMLAEIAGLSVAFRSEGVMRAAVDDLSLAIAPGEILGVAGESGSGKSVTALALMGLLPTNARLTARRLAFEGQDLQALPPRALDRLRGRRLAMIFQDPMTSLNPLLRIGRQIGEVLEVHENLAPAAARARAIELLREVGIPAPETRIDDYPHQLSGGMRQRAMIAIAMACRPRLLIADEPTTALDVSIQAQILELIARLRSENGMAVLLITHDLGVLSSLADRVVVMYAGEIVETGPAAAIFARPLHPYADRLLKSAPRLGERLERLSEIAGQPPSDAGAIDGCRFHPRCALAIGQCRSERPTLEMYGGERLARCWRAGEFATIGLPA